MLLEHKNAIIYGGGGAIGGAVAQAFAREGCKVFVVGRSRPPLDQIASAIRSAGGHVECTELDVFDEAALVEHARAVASDVGSIDVALNAIGIDHIQGPPLDELSVEEFMHPVSAYLRANFLTVKAVAPHMEQQRSGVILTLSTPGSQLAGSGYLGYGVTCGAIETFSRLLSAELGPSGVRVVCLRPNAIPETIATSHVGAVFARVADRAGVTVDDWLGNMGENHSLLGRLPSLAEVADYATFAASDRAGALTGAIANLSCGLLVD